MCLICIELMNKKMSTYDARLAYVELKSTISKEHQDEVQNLIRALERNSIPDDEEGMGYA